MGLVLSYQQNFEQVQIFFVSSLSSKYPGKAEDHCSIWISSVMTCAFAWPWLSVDVSSFLIAQPLLPLHCSGAQVISGALRERVWSHPLSDLPFTGLFLPHPLSLPCLFSSFFEKAVSWNIGIRKLTVGAGVMVLSMSMYYSSRGPEFSSLHPHQAATIPN